MLRVNPPDEIGAQVVARVVRVFPTVLQQINTVRVAVAKMEAKSTKTCEISVIVAYSLDTDGMTVLHMLFQRQRNRRTTPGIS